MAVNLKVDVSVKWGDFSRVEEVIVPKLLDGAEVAAGIVYDDSQVRVAVDTGSLKASGRKFVEWVNKKVTGYVEYQAGHAAFVEFGTGVRGQESPGAGPFEYDQNWPGMIAQPYIRPALDGNHKGISDAFTDALKK